MAERSDMAGKGTGARRRIRLSGRPGMFAAGGFAAAGIAAGLAASGGLFDHRGAAPEMALPSQQVQRQVLEMTVDDKEQILVEGADAQARNAALRKSGLPLEKIGAFALGGASASDQAMARKCLAQAIYYEAAHEPLQGQRAVAQVVLNRVRHKAYPSSVCGVVYEGSQRRTGCQFSFTCDGSLLRQPMAGPWREAEKVASEALAGQVEKSVGSATHYHADYVLPKWAFQLGKITQLGRHIFYRFNGGWGRSAAFHARYRGFERIPYIDFAALRERANGGADQVLVPGLTVTPHVTDRHAENDVGGRLDVTKQWRLSIPDPADASSRYRQALAESRAPEQAARKVAIADDAKAAAVP